MTKAFNNHYKDFINHKYNDYDNGHQKNDFEGGDDARPHGAHGKCVGKRYLLHRRQRTGRWLQHL